MKIKLHNCWKCNDSFALIDLAYEKYGVMTNLKHEIWIYFFNFGIIFAWGKQ